jgi:hypothetical protein
LRKYQEELQKRDVAIETNTPDTGRAKRSLGKLTREDLEEKIAEATQELREIEKQKEKIKKEIEEIEARPGKRL